MTSPLAVFVSFASLPRKKYLSAAVCDGPIDRILKRNRVEAERYNVKEEGGAYRAVGIRLASGRYANLVAYDDDPSEIEISIEAVGKWSLYRDDLEAIADLIGKPVERFPWVASSQEVKWR